MTLDALYTNGQIVTPEGRLGPDAAVGVSDGTIAAIGRREDLPDADEVVDLDGKMLVPGIIDDHVHTRSPGDEHKEDWETATRAAAAGGITSLIAMPNTDPMVSNPDHLQTVYDLADENALVDFQSYAVVTSENLDQIHALDEAGVAGYKVFLGTTFGEIEPPNDGELHEVMGDIAETGKRLGFHEENDAVLSHYEAKFRAEGKNRPIHHNWSRPVVAEVEAIQRTILFSEDTGCPVHMFHCSSGTGAEHVLRGKERGVNVTAETCPHYLWFTEEVMNEKGNAARVQPPIRDAAEREKLWSVGLGEGGIDIIATDHAPHTDEEKHIEDPFHDTWESISGFVGLESQVPAMLTFVDEGRLTLEQWVELHSARPAKIWGMYPEKGSLKVGTDADFTVVDLDREWTMTRDSLHSRSRTTPFNDETFTGAVETTVVRGERVFDDGELLAAPGDGERIDVDGTIEAGE
ncbi:MAG: allantoinase AllB [Haloarculaceae archaeon]